MAPKPPVARGAPAEPWHPSTSRRAPRSYAGADRRATAPRGLLAVLERHVVGADQLVAAGLPGQTPVGPVEVDLLVERDRRRLLDPELVDLVVVGQALLLVHLRLGALDHPVEVLVVPVDEDVGRLEQRHV